MHNKFEKHEFNLYPLMVKDEMIELVLELKKQGYDNSLPITLFEGKILDGWNRYNACIQAQVTPAFREFVGPREEALLYTIRTNKRRELNPGQKAIIADKYRHLLEKEAEARKNQNLKHNEAVPTTQDAKIETQKGAVNKMLSQKFDVSEGNLKKVKVLKKENPELLKEVEDGKKSLNKASKELEEKKNPAKKAVAEAKSESKKAIKELSSEQGIYKNAPNSWKVVSKTLASHLDISNSFLDEFQKFIPNPGKEFHAVWNRYRETLVELRGWCADKAVNCKHCHGTQTIWVDDNQIPTEQGKGKQITCPYCMQGSAGK
jgi:hypothetical protein